MRIIIDLDNTVLDSTTAIFEMYNKRTGEKATLQGTKMEKSMHNYCPGITDQELSGWFLLEEFFETVKPFEGCIEVLEALSEAGHEIVVASLHNQPHEPKRRWVQQHLPFVKEIHLIEFNDHRAIDKSSVQGDVMIDDNVLALTTSPAPHKVCFKYYHGYNDHWTGQSFNKWDSEMFDYLSQLN